MRSFLSMTCPRCHDNHTRVLDKRNSFAGIYRRRQCLKCNHRFTTTETIKMKLNR